MNFDIYRIYIYYTIFSRGFFVLLLHFADFIMSLVAHVCVCFCLFVVAGVFFFWGGGIMGGGGVGDNGFFSIYDKTKLPETSDCLNGVFNLF